MTKKIIPNIISILNLVCGLLAISFASHMHIISCYLIFTACFFDFLDGFIARKLNTVTEIGKKLDSFADLISFGVAPTFILFFLLQNINTNYIICFSSFLITICTAIRLVRFNLNDEKHFIGLPSPASAIFICSISMSNINSSPYVQYYFITLILITSFLMISKLKMFKIQNNLISKIFLMSSIIIMFFYGTLGLSITVFLYIALSIIKNKYEIQSKN